MEIASSIRPAICTFNSRHSAPVSSLKRSTFISYSKRHAVRNPTVRVSASAEAARLLAEAKKKYDNNDRMGALNLWEQSLKQNPETEQRIAALFNATCVHAGYGDVELAQITLREAVQRGLDFSKAVQDPTGVDVRMVKFIASQQVLVRLRKFDEATRKAMGAAAAPPFSSSSSSSPSTSSTSNAAGGAAAKRPLPDPAQYSSSNSNSGSASRSSMPPSRTKASMLDSDLSKMLETDMQGIDTSIFGIIKRVLLLLSVLTGLGVGLYVVGIKYLFPDM
ncbi:hypothetical protein NADE_007322 [Nannochloris sp. 'desiccata']|nr:hypothetical protein NADE_007322 [Chlorella desiccata (nom. nud.)]